MEAKTGFVSNISRRLMVRRTLLDPKIFPHNLKFLVVNGASVVTLLEAGTGFEPVNSGFADRPLGPLGYPATLEIEKNLLFNFNFSCSNLF